GREDDQVAGPDQLLRVLVHGDPAGRAGALQVAAEAGRAVGGQVVHADLVERPAVAGQEGVDVAGDQAGPEGPPPGRPRLAAAVPAGTEPVRRERRRRGGPGGADDRALQAGERVAGVVVVEDQYGRGARGARPPG